MVILADPRVVAKPLPYPSKVLMSSLSYAIPSCVKSLILMVEQELPKSMYALNFLKLLINIFLKYFLLASSSSFPSHAIGLRLLLPGS